MTTENIYLMAIKLYLMRLNINKYNEWVHGVSVEIELKMYWQGCKKFNIFKPCT